MLKIITGLPGHGKTSNTLALFLAETSRLKYATPITGFDYAKHGVIELANLEKFSDLPAGSLVLVDEAQKFLRPRSRTSPIPDWFQHFETHRHLGIDLWLITQHPMLIDTHVRRLCDQHWHYFKPFGIQKATTVRQWDGIRDDPNDYFSKQEAQVKSVSVPKAIFSEYTSTELDTTQARFPRKLIYMGLAIFLALLFVFYMGYSFFNKPKVSSPVSSPVLSDSALAPVDLSSKGLPAKHSLTIDDFKPVSPLVPWSAPVYSGSVRLVSAPRFSGCMASKKAGCSCVTQQGTYLDVDYHMCISVVYGKAMPFNPMRADSPDFVPPSDQLAMSSHDPSARQSVVIGQQERSGIVDEPYNSIYSK